MRHNLFKIHGGKYYLAKWIISHFPPHKHYVEGCLGAGSVFYNKTYVPSTLYESNFNIWCIHYYLKFIEKNIQSIGASPEEFEKWKEFQPTSNPEIGLREYILRKMSRVGDKTTFSQTKRLRGGRPEHVNSWENSKDKLPHFVNLAHKATVKWDTFYNHNFTPDTLVYVDPPYLHDTRTTTDEYGPHEWTENDHINLVDFAKHTPAMWFISSYPHEIYDGLGWKCHTKVMKNNSAQTKNKSERIECLWTNT